MARPTLLSVRILFKILSGKPFAGHLFNIHPSLDSDYFTMESRSYLGWNLSTARYGSYITNSGFLLKVKFELALEYVSTTSPNHKPEPIIFPRYEPSMMINHNGLCDPDFGCPTFQSGIRERDRYRRYSLPQYRGEATPQRISTPWAHIHNAVDTARPGLELHIFFRAASV